MAREGKSLSPKKRPGLKSKLDESARRLLAADVKERPFLTHSKRREYLRVVAGVSVSNSTVCRESQRMQTSRKKGGVKAKERDEFLRAAWRVLVCEVCAKGSRGGTLSLWMSAEPTLLSLLSTAIRFAASECICGFLATGGRTLPCLRA
jgi:hypothetical protein